MKVGKKTFKKQKLFFVVLITQILNLLYDKKTFQTFFSITFNKNVNKNTFVEKIVWTNFLIVTFLIISLDFYGILNLFDSFAKKNK